MRVRSLLLGPAAFFLLAGVLGLIISCYCLGLDSPVKIYVHAGRVGLITAAALLAAGGLFLVAAFARCSDCNGMRSTFLRWLLVAVVMVIPTAVLFGPTGGFHYHYGFGPFPFFYMVWNGEDPDPTSFQIVEGYEVWFNPWRFLVLLGAWGTIVMLVASVVRPCRSPTD